MAIVLRAPLADHEIVMEYLECVTALYTSRRGKPPTRVLELRMTMGLPIVASSDMTSDRVKKSMLMMSRHLDLRVLGEIKEW